MEKKYIINTGLLDKSNLYKKKKEEIRKDWKKKFEIVIRKYIDYSIEQLI